MKIIKKIGLVLVLSFTFISCEEIDAVLPSGLSNEEIISGLKSALEVSTDTSVKILNTVDGYLGDDLVKILLPDEAKVLVDNISKIPGGDLLLENTIKAINRSAEDAASEASDIFKTAISGMSITDGLTILSGTDSAATNFLRINTSQNLFNAFKPKIEASLGKKLIGNVSAESAYADLIAKYNVVAKASFGLLKEIKSYSLSEHTTHKGLHGLFEKVKLEEGNIRNDVAHRVNDILRKVFEEK